MIVELRGLRLYGRHGVLPEEQERGQTFLFDVAVEVGDAGRADRIEDAVDYRDLARTVREVSDARRFALLEALAAAVVDELLARFVDARHVRVRVRKPDVELDPSVEWAAVTAERWRS